MKNLLILMGLAVAVAGCSDSANEKTKSDVKTGLDSAGNKIERLGDTLEQKIERFGDSAKEDIKTLKDRMKRKLERNDNDTLTR